MNGADFNKVIDDALWSDIQEIFNEDEPLQFKNEVSLVKSLDLNDDPFQLKNNLSFVKSLDFTVPIASGFRFRYQSEIDKKSFSSIKGESNQIPTLKILTDEDVTLRIDLVTDQSQELHFNTFYEIPKVQKYFAKIDDGICLIPLAKNRPVDIKLDFLGIRKLKLKEAIPRIKQLYPEYTEAVVKKFYNDNKETVRLRALLLNGTEFAPCIVSNTIRSQNAKENKDIKIQHISPKTVADYGESLIIILEKKITSESTTFLEFDNMASKQLNPIFEDGQTFVYIIPEYRLLSPSMATIRIKCGDREDSKPIRFVQPSNEQRKRKSPHYDSDIPLKKPTNYDSPGTLYPESGTMVHQDDEIEFDGPHSSLDVEIPSIQSLPQTDVYISGNESCKDSGIHSNDKESNASDSDNEENDSSYSDTDDESDIEIEGVRRKRVNKVEDLEPINFPPTSRSIESVLVPNRTDKVAKKIFSEVARIGHDYAFGKQPGDLFVRIEKQLPVVFTLQDDVGDTPLNNAILKGNVEQAERILKVVREECNWALNLANTSGHTALILAPACDVPGRFVKDLLNAGCSLDMCDDLGKSAITYAIEYKNTDALFVLLEYIRIRRLGHLLIRSKKAYFSLLQIAVMNSFVEGVKMLLSLKDNNGSYMVNVNELALMNEDTALHIAVERGVGLDIIRLLLDRPDIDINHRKDKGTTVLHMALKMKAQEIVDLLQSYKAEDINEVQDSVEEIEVDDEDGSSMACDSCPVVEMNSESAGASNNCNNNNNDTVVNLTMDMANMSLKGRTKDQLIKLLIDSDRALTVAELTSLVKPSFRTLLMKYRSTEESATEIRETLDRFNCLPNSLGLLCKGLREIGREDMYQRVLVHFTK